MVYIYIYIYIERERERERETAKCYGKPWLKSFLCFCFFFFFFLNNNSKARINWSQSMQRDPNNRKLATLIWEMMAGTMINPKIFQRKIYLTVTGS